MRSMVFALTVVVALAVVASTTHAQGPTYSASKGQTAEQQSKDMVECRAIAVQQSGFDPAKAQTMGVPPTPQAGGERVRGAARGAAVGAAAGGIAGDAGKGAAAGAAAGTMGGGMRRREADREQNAKSHQEHSGAPQPPAGFDKALAGCMQGRGYTAK